MRNAGEMRILIIVGVLLIILAGTCAATSLSNSESGTWKYQQEIAIQENSGETLHDYQVLVELSGSDFPGDAQPDGDDIRFTDADGVNLGYWIEEFDAGSKRARIWVNVPLIPANGEAKITRWYGNPSAGSESDGEAVFEFFDDFSGTVLDINKWYEDAVNNIDHTINNFFRFEGATKGGGNPHPYWIYDGTDTGSQHQAKWTPLNSFILEWNSKISDVTAAEASEGGVAVITTDSTIIYYIAHLDAWAGGIVPRRYVVSATGYNYASEVNSGDEAKFSIVRDGSSYMAKINDMVVDSYMSSTQVSTIALTAGACNTNHPYLDYVQINNLRVCKYTYPEPSVTLEAARSSALSITKSPTPHSIRQFQESTITLSIKNSGTTDATDIEITDAIHPSFDLISGDFPNPKRYDLIRPGETRDLQYTISAKESGTFTLDPATVTYADEDGNIQEATSEPASIKVIPSTEGGTSGTSHSPSVSTASVQLHGEKTDVVLGEDILLKLSAVNLITKPTMHVQVIIIPPSGMSVTSSAFAKSGAGQYTTTYELEPGSGKDIEVAIRSNQIGDFDVNGRIIYYFGDDRDDSEDHTLTLPITVRAEAEQTESQSETKESSTPGFAAVVAVIGLLLAYLQRKRR
ncbi:MAG: hypothetical protein AEth_01722 [Candidatus Argoarchaeum ethanivorans]|uniref:DUF2341 domain-containing protein n=1 Tax=Candidatus Argoarchaeum ethanivorans TaxID=2608793 RepID=A0A8B3S1J1_9EURY|nr:MAG: hypothetical protein AEth_01722 [Candidatus Argoarchaeum ethanivorans]